MLRRFSGVRGVSLSVKRGFAEASGSSNQKLRNDIKFLGITLGEAIKAEDNEVFEAVEKLRLLGREVCVICATSQLQNSKDCQNFRKPTSIYVFVSGVYQVVTKES